MSIKNLNKHFANPAVQIGVFWLTYFLLMKLAKGRLSLKNKIGDVSSTYINSLIVAGESLGVDRQMILRQNNLSEQVLNDPLCRLSLVALMKVGQSIIHHTNEPALGLIAGQRSVLTALGYPGLLAMNASCLGESVAVLNRFEPLASRCNRGQSSLDARLIKPRLNFYSIAPYNEYNLFVVDRVICGWYQVIEWLTGRSDLVASVQFEFDAPAYADQYQNYFNCPVKFGEECNSIQFAEKALDTPVVYHNPHLYSSLLDTCDQMLEAISQTETIGQQVQKALGSMLHEGNPSLGEVAEQLSLPPWTLRRRLSEQGLSFHEILEELRKDLAINYVKNLKLSLGEIAYSMGFSNASAFQRAFKRWTGMTAGDYRKKLSSIEAKGR